MPHSPQRNVLGRRGRKIGIFHNAKVAVPIRTALRELNHLQPQKRSKDFDMNIYWAKDIIKRKQFFLFWDRETNNKADYFTKHFPPKYHKQILPTYLHRPSNHLMCSIRALVQGCVNPRNDMSHQPRH